MRSVNVRPASGVLLLLIGGAAWLRLRHLGLAEFKSDEALAVRIGRDILNGDFRTVGLTSSAGASNPPLFVYLTALPLAVRDSPLVATGFIGVLAALTVALTYLLLRRQLGLLTALVSAALFATAPWSVLYGRHLWQPDVMPLVCIVLLWCLLVVLQRPDTGWIWLSPFLFCLALGLNFSAIALVVPIAAVLFYRAREIDGRALVVGAVAGALSLGPWLAHNAKHGFKDFVALSEEGRGHGESVPGAGTIEAVRQTVHLIGVGGWRFVVGSSEAQLMHEARWAWWVGRLAGGATVVLFAVGAVGCLLAAVRGTRRVARWPWVELETVAAPRALLLVWLAGAWLSYAASSTDKVAPHYLLSTLPVVFVVAALGLSDIARALPRRPWARAASVVVPAAICVCFTWFTLAFQHFVGRHGGTAGDYGVTYDDKARLAAVARSRRLDVDDRVIQYLAARTFDERPDAAGVMTTRDTLRDPRPLPCRWIRLSVGPLEACVPRPRRLAGDRR